jgi:hypothetical protein
MTALWLLVFAAPLFAQEPSLNIDSYFLQSRRELVLTLRDTPPQPRTGTATVRCGADMPPASFRQDRDNPRVTITLSQELPSQAACELRLEAPGVPAGRFSFNTAPELRFVPEKLPGRFGLRMVLQANYPVDLRKSADFEVFEVTLDPSKPASGGLPPFYRRTRIPDTRLKALRGEGLIGIYFPSGRMTRSDPVVWVRNIRSTLDEPLELKDPATLRLPAAPKGKDQAYGYVAVSHYAGPRLRPGTALDVKFDPLLVRKLGFLQGPNITADIAWNSVLGLKSSDRVQLGWRGERFLRFLPESPNRQDPFLAGMRLIPSAYFETNRLRTQRNAVAELRAVWLFRDLYKPKADLTRRAYLNALAALPPGTTPPPAASQKPAPGGFNVNFESGVETGRAIDDLTVKASDGSSQIVPSFAIFRPKARMNVSTELWRFAFEGFAEFRYLAATENLYRASAILPGTGLKPSFEARVRFRIDPLGHYQFETALKNGALPPGFVYTNYYRSGLVIQY